MKKINNILSKTISIIAILKILFILSIGITMFTSINEIPLNITKTIINILQPVICIISIPMIINCISQKTKSWIGYILFIIGTLIDYIVPTLTILIIGKNILLAYIYYLSGKIIKNNNELETTKKKSVIAFNYIYITLIIIFLFYTTINYTIIYNKKKIQNINKTELIQEPYQEEYHKTKTIKKLNKKYTIDYIAKYSVSGRVTNTHAYNGIDDFSIISPLDVSITWGTTAKEKNHKQIKYYSLGDRRVYTSYSYNITYNQSEISNNHLIPKNNKIKKELSLIKRGDYVKLEGYLVNISTDNWFNQTSTTRLDSGDGSCEIIYVTKVIWLKRN